MQARYYDPVIGRFYSNDPVDALGHMQRGNPIHGFNRYTYANNNPYKYVDPTGMAGEEALAALGAFVAADTAIPDPSDLAWPKWAGYGIAGGALGILVWATSDSGEAENAAQGLPDLGGLDGDEAEEVLGDNGFGKTKTTTGGYEQWDHEDGSRVNIRPDGEVVRTGPKRPQTDNPQGKHVRDRYGPNGQHIPHRPGEETHNTGEIINR